MIKTLYDDGPVVLAWLKQAPPAWMEYLRQCRETEVRHIKISKELLDIGQTQGRLDIIDRFIGLKEELQNAVGKKG